MPRADRAAMQRAYDEVKRQIITAEIAPGVRIDEQALTRQLGISRTPVREAIFQLSAEGLVEIRPRSGFVVRSIDLLDIGQLFEAQVLLAKSIAQLAAQRATPQQLDRLRAAKEEVEQAFAARDYLAMTATNTRLHRLEAEAAHNRHIQAMAESVYDQAQRLSYLSYSGWGSSEGLDAHLADVLHDHDRMLAALQAHDPAEAGRIAVEHVRLFRRRVARFIESESLSRFELTHEDLAAVSLQAP